MTTEEYIRKIKMLQELSKDIDQSFRATNEELTKAATNFSSFLRDAKGGMFSDLADLIPPKPVAAIVSVATNLVAETEAKILKELFKDVFAKLEEIEKLSTDHAVATDIYKLRQIMYDSITQKK